jgi:hypothetical protein
VAIDAIKRLNIDDFRDEMRVLDYSIETIGDLGTAGECFDLNAIIPEPDSPFLIGYLEIIASTHPNPFAAARGSGNRPLVWPAMHARHFTCGRDAGSIGSVRLATAGGDGDGHG